MSKENPRFFIAYAHADKELYTQFKKLFVEEIPGNWTVGSDDELPLGSNWEDLIKSELAKADYIIVLLSNAFSTSAFSKNEILYIYDKSKIIPILLKPYPYTRDSFFAESNVFLFARKNANLISFEEWQVLSNSSDDINGTFSNSFTTDLLAFIKDGNADLLIGEEMFKKTKTLHLNNCGIREWPDQLFQMTWLTVLNLGNYYNDYDKSTKSFVHLGDKSLKTKKQNSISQIDSRIKELQNLEYFSLERNNLTIIDNIGQNTNLRTLELGGNQINKITGFDNLTLLSSLFLYTNQIENIEGLENLQNLRYLYLAGNKIQKLEGLIKLENLIEVYLHINNISKLEGLSGLKVLSKINLSSNLVREIELQDLPSLTWLSLDRNRIERIGGIENLISLKHLHLENNYIRKIEGLNALKNLTLLHLENNQIDKIAGLESLVNLKNLDLQRNKIEKVEGLENLGSLTKLNLSENNLQSSNGILSLNVLKLTEVNFKKNPFTHDTWLNQEILEAIGDNKDKFFAFLLDKQSSRLREDYLPPIKIILLGNSEDGKTSLALKLIEGWDSNITEDSTHGLKIRKWEIDHLRTALIYDFGGQDYYHASYNMFFTWNTGYILVWDAARQTTQMVNKSRNNELLSAENLYRVFPIVYWLGNIDYWKRKKDLQGISNSTTSNPSQIKLISVQNLFKSESIITIPDSKRIDYQVAAYLGSDQVMGIQKTRQQLVKESILDSFELLFRSPLSLTTEDIEIMQEILNVKEYKVLTVDEFKANYPKASPYLLDILHSRGIVLNYRDVETIKNYVWLSPVASSAEIFNALNLAALEKNGKVETNQFPCEEKLKLLMIHSEILFEHNIEGGLNEYVIPSYLKISPKDDALLTLATTDLKSGFNIRFKEYMPHGMMARLICRLGKWAGSNHFYRDLLIFSISLPESNLSVKVWIKVDFGELSLDVKSNVNDKLKQKLHEYLFYSILLAYWNVKHIEIDKFKNLPTSELSAEGILYGSDFELKNKDTPFINLVKFPFYLSLDGEYFLNYLEDLKPENDDSYIHLRLFRWGNNSNTKEEFRAAFNSFTLIKIREPKKLFISYSSKDSAFMKRLTTHLESLKREGHISYWVDRMIETGTSWDDKIRLEMESSDIIIYLLSPHFLATTYIMDIELPKGIQLVEKNNDKTKLEFVQLMPCGWKRIPGLRMNQQLLDNEALGKDMVIINSHDNDNMWMKVIENLATRIENIKKIKI